jgi:hypothetical protein
MLDANQTLIYLLSLVGEVSPEASSIQSKNNAAVSAISHY